MCQCDIRKYSFFCYRVVNIWNSLWDYVVEVVFNFNSELMELEVCM